MLSYHEGPPTDYLDEEFDELSKRLEETEIQEACSVRNVAKARALATALIRDDGDLAVDTLGQMIAESEKKLYSLSPGHHYDAVRDEHILAVLRRLHTSKEFARLIKNITRPLTNRIAEEIIRDTLLIETGTPVTDVHARRACLAAWLTMLRQSLGSCFATAPSILIHEEQPALFLHDLDEMMSTGRMKRTFGGVEYSVPLSPSWGNGDLKKPIVFSKGNTGISRAPGLLAAMEAVGIIPKTLPLKEKTTQLRALIEASIDKLEKQGKVFLTNAQELISAMLLKYYTLRQKDIDDYLHRPKGMLTSGIMMHVPKTSKLSGARGDPCIGYLRDFEIAKKGFRALADCALLKAWEFTVASFAEVKLDFARFNLYTSLGVNYDDPGGIGECLYSIISKKVEQTNAEMKEYQDKYDDMFVHIRYLETRLRQATTENEIQWLKVEYQSRRTEVYHIEQLRNMAHARASKVAGLYEFLIKTYDAKFFDYFQEVYDPEIHDVAGGPFDDSPAGFRLLYKHGRTNPSQWTRIFSMPEFVEALVSFFTITEQEVVASPEVAGIEAELSFIITQVVNHVRSDAFLESALYRMARACGGTLPAKPLDNLDKVEKKPWVYASGGSMHTLVSAYFRREERPTEVERWVETETELFAFFIDSLKQIPEKYTQVFLDNPKRSMLMHSPTHAFLLKPGFSRFVEGWKGEMYTYSWIKHAVIEPAARFADTIYIEEAAGHEIAAYLEAKIPHDFRPRYRELTAHFPYRLSLRDFHHHMESLVTSDRGLRGPYGPIISSDDITSAIYRLAPFTTANSVPSLLEEVFSAIFAKKPTLAQKIHELLDRFWRPPYEKECISAEQLCNSARAFAALVFGTTRCEEDISREIVRELRAKGALFPEPVIFADSNWVRDYFAFVTNPVSAELELWSVDILGCAGRPMSFWKEWLNGSRRDPKWGIFTNFHEYVGA